MTGQHCRASKFSQSIFLNAKTCTQLTTNSVHCLSVFSGDLGNPLLFSLTKNLSLYERRDRRREHTRRWVETAGMAGCHCKRLQPKIRNNAKMPSADRNHFSFGASNQSCLNMRQEKDKRRGSRDRWREWGVEKIYTKLELLNQIRPTQNPCKPSEIRKVHKAFLRLNKIFKVLFVSQHVLSQITHCQQKWWRITTKTHP